MLMKDDVEIGATQADSMEADDATLLQQYADHGDQGALEILFRRHANILFATAMQICRQPADAQDAVQMALIRVMRDASTYRGTGTSGVLAWITRIVICRCKDRIRSESRRRKWENLAAEEQFTEFASATEPAPDDYRLGLSAREALDALPEHYRLPITLHHCQGLSLKETANALAISNDTLHTQLRRGLDQIRQQLAAGGAETSLTSLVAVLPLLYRHAAPRALLENIPEILAGRLKDSSARLLAPWLIRTAAAVLLIGGAASIAVMVAREDKTATRRPAPTLPASPSQKIDYRWTFDSPDLPKEFQIIQGTMDRLPNSGINDSGCLLISNAIIRIDIPIETFPVVVSFFSSIRNPQAGVQYKVISQWLPARSMALYNGVSSLPTVPISRKMKQSPWAVQRDYYSGAWISRWNRSQFHEFRMVPMQSDGRVNLTVANHAALIDNLSISSISTNELPDMRKYTDFYDRIPQDKRRGHLPCPELKGSGNTGTKTAFITFYTNCTQFNVGTVLD